MALPSPKVSLYLGLLLVVVVGYLWYLGGHTGGEKNTAPIATSTAATTTDPYADLEHEQSNLQSLLGSSTTTITYFSTSTLPKPFVLKNLKTTNDISSSSIQRYGLDIVKTLKPFEAQRDNEVSALLIVLDTHDPVALAKISASRDMYQTATKSLLTMRVPKNAAASHLILLNQTNRVAALLNNMSQVLTEPVLAIGSGLQYLDDAPTFFNAVGELNKYFADQKITFTDQNKLNLYINLNQ